MIQLKVQAQSEVEVPSSAPSVGDELGGGIVFKVTATDVYISADADLGSYEWGCHGTGISGADGTGIGTGKQNTLDILAGCSDTDSAAYICDNATINGYSDWYLPSKDELDEMYLNKTTIGGFLSTYYWSSSEDDGYGAWVNLFINGIAYSHGKSNLRKVRPIRSYSLASTYYTPTDYLDLGDVSIKANYSAIEIQDVTKRKSESTQAFSLPFTTKNNKFFSHYYNVNSDGSFDANIKANATIIAGGTEILGGYLQLLSVNTITEVYECVVFGEVASIVKALGISKLNELDLSELSHVFTKANILDSWDGNTTYTTSVGQTGDEILYPIIDYGYNYTSESIIDASTPAIEVDKLKPSINVKYLLYKILTGLGYSINSTFLTSDFFTKQYMTIANDTQRLENTYQDGYRVGLSTDATMTASSTTSIWVDDESSTNAYGDFFDLGGNYYTGIVGVVPPYYPVPSSGFHNFQIRLEYQMTGGHQYADKVVIKDYNSGSPVEVGFIPVGTTYSSIYNQHLILQTGDISLEAGQQIYFQFECGGNAVNLKSHGTNVQLISSPPATIGATIDLSANNNVLSNDKQVDFITSIMSRYNLIIERDKDLSTQLNIEPAQDYFDEGTSRDWSGKLDHSKSIVIKPTSEYRHKKLNFKDLEDEDNVNAYWLKEFSEVYNSYELDLSGDFGVGELEIKSIFSSFATSRVESHDMSIAKFYAWEEGVCEFVKTKPKLFYYSGTKDCNDYRLFIGGGSTTNELKDEYPFCDHLSMSGDVVTSSDVDIRFKSKYASGGQFYVEAYPTTDVYSKCWRKYLNSIYSKESRVLVANFLLNDIDIASFKYNDKIFVKDAYYRINKIKSYAVGKDVPTQVELIKIIDNNLNDSMTIGGCDLVYGSPNINGTTTWFEDSAKTISATPTQVCCESQGMRFFDNNCYWNLMTPPPPPRPPIINNVVFGGGVTLGVPNKETTITSSSLRLSGDGADADIKLDGNVTQIGTDTPSDGEVLSWNDTDGNTEWVTNTPSPAGLNHEVQFNDNGTMAGNSAFTFDDASGNVDATSFTGDGSGLTGLAAGSDQHVQFNSSNELGASSGLKYNHSSENLTIGGTCEAGQFQGENIGVIYDLEMYLMPQDFIQPSSSSSSARIYTQYVGAMAKVAHASYYMQASFQVPLGYQVRKVYLTGNNTQSFIIGVSSWGAGSGVGAGGGNMGTEVTLTYPLVGTKGTYWTISYNPSSTSDAVYGCRLTLEKV